MTSSARARAPDAASTDSIGIATLETLARTARQVALYGPKHPIAAKALSGACLDLGAAAAGGRLEVQAQADGLLWNGVPLERKEGNVARFHSSMRERLIASIEVSARVREADLAWLLLVLAMDPEELAADGGVGELSGEKPGSTIRVSEVDFSHEVLVSDDVWRRLSEGLDPEETGGLRRLIATCARSLEPDEAAAGKTTGAAAAHEVDREKESAEEVVAAGIARLIQQAGETTYFTNHAEWQEWRETMARQLSALNPRWRSTIFRAPVGSLSSECPDMLALVASEMDASDCVSLVLDHPDSIRAERSDMLAIALDRILADPTRRTDIEAALHKQALAQGVPEEVYQNVVGLLIARMEGKLGPESQGPSFHPKVRKQGSLPAIERAEEDVGDLLRTTDPEAVRRSRLFMLQESLAARLTISQYGTVISLLTKAAEECAAHSDVEALMTVIASLGDEASGRAGQDASRRAVAAGALARSSTERVVLCLTDSLEDAPAGIRKEIIRLLGLLGEPGLRALVQIVRVGEDNDVRQATALLLERDDHDLSHLRDLVSEARGITLERALQALMEVRGDEAAGKIATVISDAGEEARLQVLALITEGRLTDLASLLAPLLADSSGAVRSAAVKAIAELRVQEAVPALCELVERESNFGEGARLKEAAVRSLGALGAGSAVPVLCQVLKGRAFLSKIGSHRTRIAAAEALAALGGPDSREALARGCRSMHPAVRESCRRALSRLLAAERTTAGVSGAR